MTIHFRPIVALAIIGTVGLLASGCSSGDGDPAPSATRTRSAAPSPSASATPTATAPATTAPTDTATEEPGDTPSVDPTSGAGGQTDPDAGTFPATAVVTFATWDRPSSTLQAAGLVSGTADASGTCTFTATMGGTSRTTTSAATSSAGSVNCAQAEFPTGQLTTGTWSVTLAYALGGKSTVSAPMTAEVP